MANSSLNRTIGTPSNADKITISSWVKRSAISASNVIIGEYVDSNNRSKLQFKSDDTLEFFQFHGGNTQAQLRTNRLFRDPSAWYHIVFQYDSAQASSSDRMKMWVNGQQETSFSIATYPSQDTDCRLNVSGRDVHVGEDGNNGTYFDGYLSHFVLVDNAIVAPTSFGETDSTSGIWKFKSPSGITWGNNGYHLKFENSAALGTDSSGNSNNFTVNGNLKQALDTPSNVYATFNSIATGEGGALPTFANGNLSIIRNSASWRTGIATIGGLTQGKWYYECKAGTISGSGTNRYIQVGVSSESASFTNVNSYHDSNYSYAYHWSGQKYVNNSASSFGTAITTGDIVMIALDFDNNYIYAGLNGTWQNSGDPTSGSSGTGALSSLQSGESWFPSVSVYNTTHEINFGNGYFGTTAITSAGSNGNGSLFEYDVPSGFYALNTKNINTYG